MKLPIYTNPAVLVDPFKEAFRRFIQIERCLQRDSILQTNYNAFMEEYLFIRHMQMFNYIEHSMEILYFVKLVLQPKSEWCLMHQ